VVERRGDDARQGEPPQSLRETLAEIGVDVLQDQLVYEVEAERDLAAVHEPPP